MASTINASTTLGLISSADTSGVLQLQTANTAAVTIDASQNVGVGTSSPNTKIEAYTSSSGAQALLTLQQADNTPGNSWGIDFRRTGSSANVVRAKIFAVREGGDATALALSYTTSGGTLTQGLYLNSDGNLGLGVTPSAWGGGYKAFDVNAGSVSATTGAGNVIVSNNAYFSGANWIYKATGGATDYVQTGGEHRWRTAASGTAGNAISFTQAMTLDASGRLVIGHTAAQSTGPAYPLQVKAVGGGAGGYGILNSSNVISGGIKLGSSSDNSLIIEADPDNLVASSFVGLNVDGSERARIDSSGRVCIGGTTVTDGHLLNIQGSTASNNIGIVLNKTNATAQIWGITNTGPLAFYNYTAASEAMRIDTSGNLLVGTASNSGNSRMRVIGNVADDLVRFENANAAPYGLLLYYSAASPNSTGSPFLECYDSVGQRATIRSNGGLANYSGNNVNLSDRREKTNIAPAGEYLSKICSIPVQTFNYIDQNLEEDAGLTLGVVAQDVQAVAPELVMESNWAKEGEEPKMRLSIYQTDLQYALMKCIQEQQTIIQQLQADIATLKGN